jgi:hypothetical protein
MLGGIAEFMITFVAILIMTFSFLPLSQNLNDSRQAAIAATEIATIRDAASQYITDNWSSVYTLATTPSMIPLSTLQSSGYLTGTGLNSWQQSHALLVMQSGTSGLFGLVVTYGGIPIPANRIQMAASLIGKYGAYIPYQSDPVPCHLPCVKGIGSFWSQSLTPFVSAGLSTYIPTSGHLAVGLLFQGGQATSPYLCRYNQPGNSACTTMNSAINMNNNSINNASSLSMTGTISMNNNAITNASELDLTNGSSTQSITYNDASLLNSLNSGNFPSSTLSNGNLSISGNLTVNGAVTAPDIYHLSDRRLKENIQNIVDPITLIRHLKGVRFRWKESQESSLGFIAQDVQESLPDIVKQRQDGFFAVDYDSLTAPLVEAVKESANNIDALKKDIEKLKEERQ